jgi:hypothetical protein
MIKPILVTALCISGLWAAPAKAASCGGAPMITYLDTLGNGAIVYREGQQVDTSYPADLKDSVDALFRREKHVAVATVHGTCNPPSFQYGCFPGSCSFTISIDTVLQGNNDKHGFTTSFSYGCGWDNTGAFMLGKSFLIFSDSTPFSRMTASGPCYSHPRGYFVEIGNIVSPMAAVGQSLPIRGLKKHTVGINEQSIRVPRKGSGNIYRVDGREQVREKLGMWPVSERGFIRGN